MPHHFAAISVSAAGVCIALALLLRWKSLRRAEFLKPWLYLIAGIGLAAAFLGSWAHTVTRWAVGAVPYVGSAVPVVVAIVLAYIVIYDLWPRHDSNTVTEISALLLPAFGPEIGGAFGSMLSTVLSSIAVTGARILSTLLGV
jgi:heme A synthase